MLGLHQRRLSWTAAAVIVILLPGCATWLVKSQSHSHSGCSCHSESVGGTAKTRWKDRGHRSAHVPDQYPLGSVMRAHLQQMETNGEAADFILHQKDFIGDSAELTPEGKDKVLEIATRMPATPFPILVERTWNNADPELDSWRRDLVAEILTDLGNSDANNRVIVAPAYSPGRHSAEGIADYSMHAAQGANSFLDISVLNP